MQQDAGAPNADWVAAAVERFEGQLLRYVRRLTGDLESARDVVQDTFLKLCREQPGELDGHLAQWLYTVSRRRALDVVKKESRMRTASDVVVEDHPLPSLTAERQEAASEVQELVDRLPVHQQEVLRLKFQAGLTYREISNVTGLSVTNVGYLIHTAIASLRNALVPGGAS